MSPLLSRVAVIAAGLPLVLFAAYYGDWALYALVAPAAVLALHELYRMGRSLRPLVLAGYGGALAAVTGAWLGGPEWMLGGFLLTLFLAFLFAAVLCRQPGPVVSESRRRDVSPRDLECGNRGSERERSRHRRRRFRRLGPVEPVCRQ